VKRSRRSRTVRGWIAPVRIGPRSRLDEDCDEYKFFVCLICQRKGELGLYFNVDKLSLIVYASL
jgi:hypothetical protein